MRRVSCRVRRALAIPFAIPSLGLFLFAASQVANGQTPAQATVPATESAPEQTKVEASNTASRPAPAWTDEKKEADRVVILHGLGRTSWSMLRMEAALSRAGYDTHNLGYPSMEHSIDELVEKLKMEIESCCAGGQIEKSIGPRVHFVTHSLGGILVRAYLTDHDLANLGRVVMLAPPNQGSEIVDVLRERSLFRFGIGPSGTELGTDQESVPRTLDPVDFELGVITGDATNNPLFSWWIPGPDDGKVSVESARVDGMSDFLVLPYSHTFIMNATEVIDQTKHFLEHGCFASDSSTC